MHSGCEALAHFLFATATMSRVMKRANVEVYDKLGKVKKEVVRNKNCLRDVVGKSKAKQEKAVARVRQKYEREVVLAVDAATSASKLEIKQVSQAPSKPVSQTYPNP
jgi:hypothetical protein